MQLRKMVFLSKLRKRSGELKDFDATKLMASLTRAVASDYMARRIWIEAMIEQDCERNDCTGRELCVELEMFAGHSG